jgi:hypothetical protein
MRLSTFLPVLGLAGQALAASHSCAAKLPGSGLPSDKDVKAYFDNLAPATKKTLLHDTTGPEAGADVRSLFSPPPSRVLYEMTNPILSDWHRCSGHPGSQPPRVLGLLAARRLPRIPPLAERTDRAWRHKPSLHGGRPDARARPDTGSDQPRRKRIHWWYRGGRVLCSSRTYPGRKHPNRLASGR